MTRASRGYSFVLRPEQFSIHRLPPDRDLDVARLRAAGWFAVTGSEEELSVVAPQEIDLGAPQRDDGWSCLGVAGTLDFALVGVIAEIAALLAGANVSIFVVSSYDTDYILIKTVDIKAAVGVLTDAGHTLRTR